MAEVSRLAVQIEVHSAAETREESGAVVYLTARKPRREIPGATWEPKLAASRLLRSEYQAGLSTFEDFRARYLLEVGRKENVPRLAELRKAARIGRVIFATDLNDPEHSDASVLAALLGLDDQKRPGQKDLSYVYAIELDPEQGCVYDAYVGETNASPEERMADELNLRNIRTPVVRDCGVRLMYEEFEYLNPIPDRRTACAWEGALAEYLEARGFRVKWGTCQEATWR